MKYIRFSTLVIAALLTAACAKQAESETSEEAAAEEAGMVDVTLTAEQAQKLKIAVGALENYTFADGVEVKGQVEVSPQSVASVTPYVGANVKAVYVREGDVVAKGKVLATLSHPDLLELQSRLLNAVGRISYVSQELERQKKMVAGNAGSGKDLQQAQSEYRVLQAEIRTVSAQLRLIGINPESVKAGKTVTEISVTAPISGTVEVVNTSTGQYADPQAAMFRIVNTDHIFADMLVYEKDLRLVKEGQTIVLTPQSSPGRTLTAKIYSVGKTVDAEAKGVHVRANFTGDRSGLATGMYLRGKIATAQSQSLAVPEDGIVEVEGQNYIFSASKKGGDWIYHPVAVTKGREENGFVEVVLTGDRPSSVVLNGAYYVISEMKKLETGEDD